MYESVDVVSHKKARPELHHSVTEFTRAGAEMFLLGSLWPLLGGNARGDGHPVLVLPGFLGGDLSTLLCRRFLQQQGFSALAWQQGRNTGREDVQAGLHKRFLQISEQYQRPVSIVGHSLGGVFAREIARQHPNLVRSVVSLGSPFGTIDGSAVTGFVRGAFERVSRRSVAKLRADLSTLDLRKPPGVPATAIFSRADGVVHWQSCVEQPSELTENIEVRGSHCGMVVNPSVLLAIADRLSQPEGSWRKFASRSVIGDISYPRRAPAGVEYAAN